MAEEERERVGTEAIRTGEDGGVERFEEER